MQNYLWITDIGSKMWSLPHNKPLLYTVYQMPTSKLLENFDEVSLDSKLTEIGTFITKLCLGDIQALWSMFSPAVIRETDTKKDLQSYALQSLSKQYYQSIYDIAQKHFTQAFDHNSFDSQLSLKQCICTLNFGINLFECGKLRFDPVLTTPSIEDINVRSRELKLAYEQSFLPNQCFQAPIKNYLTTLRYKSLVGAAESLDRDSQGSYTGLQMHQEDLICHGNLQ